MNNILKRFLVVSALFISMASRADEGMWLPQLLESLNEKRMKSLGMKINASDIYNINKGSLKDAIVSFGGFCTGEVISSQGLLLTNHHCGFDVIQNHSTVERNYIKNGFWAMNKAQELPNPGLFVTFIVRIEDITLKMLQGVTSGMSESDRQSQIDKNAALVRDATTKESYQNLLIRPFFEGNKYYMFITESYHDIRLVGAPPSAIGNFGKDTDNWMWPRHTGDFSMFRIYAGKDNKPAAYSPDNVPYVPKKSLSISLDGIAPNDFTMIFGFPGRTNQYLPAKAVQQIMLINDPAKIAIRDKALGIIDRYMKTDDEIAIQYASKYAGISNSWKKWQGEVLGLTKTNALGKKEQYENSFQTRVNADAALKSKYGNLLADLNKAYDELEPLGLARDYFLEITSKIELFTAIRNLMALDRARGTNAYAERLQAIKETMTGFYKEYNAQVDKELFTTLLEMYVKDQPAKNYSTLLTKQSILELADRIYKVSNLDEGAIIMTLLNNDPDTLLTQIKKDEAYLLYNDMAATYNKEVAAPLNAVQEKINLLQREYMQAQMEVFKEKTFYPDANSTMRVAFGNVKGYEPRNGVSYEPYTYMKGIMEKYKPGDYEFDLPIRLRELYNNKDFGVYGVKDKNGNQKMPVCFIATNHTTGGNSGSPTLDAYGNLIGLNFDRVWEGTMSDINYDPEICRNIMVDIRYVLFIIDKYAGAGHLIKEMKLVHPKAAQKKRA